MVVKDSSAVPAHAAVLDKLNGPTPAVPLSVPPADVMQLEVEESMLMFAPEATIDQMVDRIQEIDPKSGSDALRELRRAFPDSPLTLRVNALEALMRRWDLPKAR